MSLIRVLSVVNEYKSNAIAMPLVGTVEKIM